MAKRRKTLAGASLELREIEPLTRNQLTAFESDKNLVLHGLAGTGKTFISSFPVNLLKSSQNWSGTFGYVREITLA